MLNKEFKYILSQLDNAIEAQSIILEALNNIKNAITEIDKKENENGDVPVGKSFKYEGKKYIVKKVGKDEIDCITKGTFQSVCEICAFGRIDSDTGELVRCDACDRLCCASYDRHDENEVYFNEKQ